MFVELKKEQNYISQLLQSTNPLKPEPWSGGANTKGSPYRDTEILDRNRDSLMFGMTLFSSRWVIDDMWVTQTKHNELQLSLENDREPLRWLECWDMTWEQGQWLENKGNEVLTWSEESNKRRVANYRTSCFVMGKKKTLYMGTLKINL